MRHAAPLLVAALLAACQVAPVPPSAPASAALRPVADGVTAVGQLSLGRQIAYGLQAPTPQKATLPSMVASLEVYVAEAEAQPSRYGLQVVNDCNNFAAPSGTRWTSASFSGTPGATPLTLTLTGLPRDKTLLVTLVAKDASDRVLSCHAQSTVTLSTAAGSLSGSVVTPAPTFLVQLWTVTQSYFDRRKAPLNVTDGRFVPPSEGPRAVGATVVPTPGPV
jgi:hypothetical protein